MEFSQENCILPFSVCKKIQSNTNQGCIWQDLSQKNVEINFQDNIAHEGSWLPENYLQLNPVVLFLNYENDRRWSKMVANYRNKYYFFENCEDKFKRNVLILIRKLWHKWAILGHRSNFINQKLKVSFLNTRHAKFSFFFMKSKNEDAYYDI